MAWSRFFVLFLVAVVAVVRAQPPTISTSIPLPPLQWLNLSALLSGPAPPPLKDPSIAYDDASRSLIVFGGESEGGFVQSQTYLCVPVPAIIPLRLVLSPFPVLTLTPLLGLLRRHQPRYGPVRPRGALLLPATILLPASASSSSSSRTQPSLISSQPQSPRLCYLWGQRPQRSSSVRRLGNYVLPLSRVLPSHHVHVFEGIRLQQPILEQSRPFVWWSLPSLGCRWWNRCSHSSRPGSRSSRPEQHFLPRRRFRRFHSQFPF